MAIKGNLTKARLTESMLQLIQTSGYSGTGLNAVIEHAGAPKGSVYFHFPPDGKEGLGVAAVELAAKQFEALIAEAAVSAGSAAEAARTAIEVLAAIVSESNFRLGCPVSVVTLEMGAESERLRQACAAAFESWIAPTSALLEASGLEAGEARSLATVVVSTIEGGAVIVSRAMQSTQPCFRPLTSWRRSSTSDARPLAGRDDTARRIPPRLVFGGASGMVGRRLVLSLAEAGANVTAAVRTPESGARVEGWPGAWFGGGASARRSSTSMLQRSSRAVPRHSRSSPRSITVPGCIGSE